MGVVSQPDRRRGRGKKVSPSPVSEVALRHAIPLLRPEKVGDPETVKALHALEPDLGVVVAFGQFLPRKVRELPTCGYLINAHASLLPKHRGASPIAQSILEGDAETGISVMRIEREMDAGPVALVRRTPIGAQENTVELTARLAELAAEGIEEAVDQIAADQIEWTEQDASRATLAPKIEKSDSILCLEQPAAQLVRRIHALSPKPGGALTLISGGASGRPDGEAPASKELLRVSRATAMPFDESSENAHAKPLPRPQPGAVDQSCPDAPLRIATGDGWLVPLVIQRAGGRALPIADFLRGYTIGGHARFAVLPEPSAAEGEGTG